MHTAPYRYGYYDDTRTLHTCIPTYIPEFPVQ